MTAHSLPPFAAQDARSPTQALAHAMRPSAFPAVLVLAVIVCAGAATAQSDGFYEVGGITYYMAVGDVRSGNMTLGIDYEAQDRVPFAGCAVAKVRPDRDTGRVRMMGLVHGAPLEMELSAFEAPHSALQGGIAVDIPIDGSHTHGSIQHPAVVATVGVWGEAQLYSGPMPVMDPVTGGGDFAASLFITETGFREDATGRVRNADGSPYEPGDRAVRERGDWEMHMRIESKGGAQAPPAESRHTQPPQGMTPSYLPPSEAHMDRYTWNNVRFGGNATLEIDFSSMALAGENDLIFTLREPGGIPVAELQGTPSLGNPYHGTASVPLDRFGEYVLDIKGKVNLSQYTVRFVQQTPPSFDMNFWWENVTFGSHAPSTQDACEDVVKGATMSSLVPPRPPHPGYPLSVAVFLVAGTLTATLVMIKVMLMARAQAVHRRAVKG